MHILNQVEVTDIEQQNNDKRAIRKMKNLLGEFLFPSPEMKEG